MADHYAERLGYILSDDTFITILVTLVVFIIGLGINTYLSYKKRKSQRLLVKLNHWLFFKEANKQSIDYDNYKKQLYIDHVGNFTFQFRLISSISVFKEFGYENTFNAYFGGIENILIYKRTEKIKAFFSLWRHIEFVLRTHDKSIIDSEELVQKNTELNELRNESIGKAQKFMEQFMLNFDGELDVETKNDPFITFYFNRKNIFTELTGKTEYRSPTPMNTYLQQLIDLNRRDPILMRRYDTDIHSVDFNAIVLEAEVRYINMKHHLDSKSESYGYLSDEYKKVSCQLVSSYRILNGTFFWSSLIKEICYMLIPKKYHRFFKLRLTVKNNEV